MTKRKRKLKNRMLIAAGAAGILILIALLSGIIAPHDPYATNAELIRQAPSAEFLFGTDNLGRCVLSRVLVGARTTIAATFFLVAVSFAIGICVGMVCGYYGGIIDRKYVQTALERVDAADFAAELGSLAEHAVSMGAKIPGWLPRILAISKEAVDAAGEAIVHEHHDSQEGGSHETH